MLFRIEEAGGGSRLFLPSLPSAVAAFSCASFQRLGTPGGFQAHSPTKLIASLPGHLHLTLGWIWYRIFYQSQYSFSLGPWWVMICRTTTNSPTQPRWGCCHIYRLSAPIARFPHRTLQCVKDTCQFRRRSKTCVGPGGYSSYDLRL